MNQMIIKIVTDAAIISIKTRNWDTSLKTNQNQWNVMLSIRKNIFWQPKHKNGNPIGLKPIYGKSLQRFLLFFPP